MHIFGHVVTSHGAHRADTGTDQKMWGPKLTRRGRADSCRVGPGTEENTSRPSSPMEVARRRKNVRQRTHDKREQVWDSQKEDRCAAAHGKQVTSKHGRVVGVKKKRRATASNGWSVAFHGVDDAVDRIFPDDGDDEL